MDIKGHRECLDCGNTWHYGDTRSVACTECGSVRSRAVEDDDGDAPVASGIPVDDVLAEGPVDAAAAIDAVEDRCRRYRAEHDPLEGGELRPPDPLHVMAGEVLHLATALQVRGDGLTDDEERYAVELLRGLPEGEPPTDRPVSLDAVHNLAVADAVEDYATAVARYARSGDAGVPDAVERARDLAKRTQATEGEESDAVEGLRALRDAYEELAGEPA